MKSGKKKNFTIDDLALLVGRGFNTVDKRFNTVDKRFNAMDKRFGEIDERFNTVDKKLFEINQRLGRKELQTDFRRFLGFRKQSP